MLRRTGKHLAAAAARSTAAGTATFASKPLFTEAPRTAADVVAPIVQLQVDGHVPKDALAGTLLYLSYGTFAMTYLIIVNWIYQGYLDLWDGTYGLDDDDDEDD